MPLIALALQFEAMYEKIEKEIGRVQRRELMERAKQMMAAVKASIKPKSAGRSAPGSPFRSHTGNAKRSLRYKVGMKGDGNAYALLGYTRPNGSHAHLLETTGRNRGRRGKMAPRPTLEPALERNARSPFRARL